MADEVTYCAQPMRRSSQRVNSRIRSLGSTSSTWTVGWWFTMLRRVLARVGRVLDLVTALRPAIPVSGSHDTASIVCSTSAWASRPRCGVTKRYTCDALSSYHTGLRQRLEDRSQRRAEPPSNGSEAAGGVPEDDTN